MVLIDFCVEIFFCVEGIFYGDSCVVFFYSSVNFLFIFTGEFKGIEIFEELK